MVNKYAFDHTTSFLRDFKKLSKDRFIKEKIINALNTISINPFDITLKTHIVNIPDSGRTYSSRVTGDLRVLWRFSRTEDSVIILLKVGSHDYVYR